MANIESYSVTLDDSFTPDDLGLAEIIAIVERLYQVSYARYQYYIDTRNNYVYCGSDYMGRIVAVRASRETGTHYTFEAVGKLVKL